MDIDGIWISPAMISEISEITGTHRTTVARWYRNKRLPPAIHVLLDLLKNGSLERIHPDWCGWQLCPKTGALTPPNGDPSFRPGHLYAMQLNYQLISALKKQNLELRRQLAQMEQLSDPANLSIVAQ